ncbi:DNA binding protein with helix-turn-helix domain [Actinoalloteichus sp. GBA129-24]|nr:DNA binding protein with helix-turn-helix domain [Actinoalloteichus sp. GBA129-24]
MSQQEPIGVLVRRWRERRRRSQLDLSIAADVSTRHLSFIEAGRSQPSRAMIERLCDELDVPFRERNGFSTMPRAFPAQRRQTYSSSEADFP